MALCLKFLLPVLEIKSFADVYGKLREFDEFAWAP